MAQFKSRFPRILKIKMGPYLIRLAHSSGERYIVLKMN